MSCPSSTKVIVYQTACSKGTYGSECREVCGQCKHNDCDHVNGSCLSGCDPGFYGDLCTTPCSNGTYGQGCNKTCGHCLDQETCFHSNGTCLSGCDPGYTGDLCTTLTDIHTTATTHEQTTPMSVLPIFRFGSNRPLVREGNSVDIELVLLGNATYKLQWFHDGYLVTSSSKRYKASLVEVENGTIIHVLHIAKVYQRDAGEWKVQVSNDEISETRNITLQVIPMLVLRMIPQFDFSIQTGDTLSLKCVVDNLESLTGVHNGSLLISKDGSLLPAVNDPNFFATRIKIRATTDDSGKYSCEHSSYPNPVFTSVYITVIKPEQKRCEGDHSDGILWNATLAGTMKKELCPADQIGTATRFCDLEGVWESPDLINCTAKAFANASLQLDNMLQDGVQNLEKTQEALKNTLQVMKNLTSSTDEMSAGDLSSSVDILGKIVDVTNSTGSHIEKEVFFSVVDNVLSLNNSKSWNVISEKAGKDASVILKNMDRISEVVIQNKNISASQFSGSNFEVTINKTNIGQSGIQFPDRNPENRTELSDESSSFLKLPKQDTGEQQAIGYVAVVYKTISDVLSSSSDSVGTTEMTSKKKASVNSQVLSLTTQKDIGPLNPPLNLTFRHIQEITHSGMQAVCVSWDFTINKWTEKGCTIKRGDSKETVCQCNHLTNFAILMRPYTPEQEQTESLKTISLVGVILSILFTVLTFTIYILTWRFIKSDQNIMMLNLCVSLVLAYVIFIAAVEQTEIEGLCIAITAVLHYLFLATFFNMLGMGVYYFMSITVTFYAMYVANNFKSKSRIRWFLMASWGIPVIIALITLGSFWGKEYHLRFYCWLSTESGSIYMFIVPVCLVAVMNLIIIISLVRVLCASSVMTKSSLKKKATSGLRSLGTLLPVLGVTWLFGILAVNEKAEAFQYIFVIANSLQGFFIFVSHVLLNKKVMHGLRNKYPVINALVSFTESSKEESSSVSHTQSSSRPNSPLLNTKKKSLFERILRRKGGQVCTSMKKEQLEMEKTLSTVFATEKSCEASEDGVETTLTEPIMEEDKPKRRFGFPLNLSPWKKKYTVTGM